MYRYLAAAGILLLMTGCGGPKSDFKKLITGGYPVLYEAVFERDGTAIMQLIETAEDSALAEQGWRALINTPVQDTGRLIERVLASHSASAPAALWFKDITPEQLAVLHNAWLNNPEKRTGLASVLGRHGNTETLALLLDTDLNNASPELKFETAYAIGLLTMNNEPSVPQQVEIVERALAEADPETGRAYLYGYYRSGEPLAGAATDTLFSKWTDKGRNPLFDQYAMKLLIPEKYKEVLHVFELPDYARLNVQLAVEVASSIAEVEDEEYGDLILSSLLDHRNPNVVLTVLNTVKHKHQHSEILDRVIESKVIKNEILDPAVRLEGINTIMNPSRFEELTTTLAGENPYLQALKYAALRNFYTNTEFFELLKTDMESEDALTQLFAANEFALWWEELDESEKTEEQTESAKALLQNSMQGAGRSVVYGMAGLLKDETLLPDSDFRLITNLLQRFELPEDVEVFQKIAEICEIRFGDQASPLLDSLAGLGNSALNKTLAGLGVEVPAADSPAVSFRNPDWKRLAKLGPHPVMHLRLDKGVVRIRLNTASAPATIAGIDSLVEAGAYNGVAFHRVVPNFVVQGGDVETGDGFGGPGYVVPTEASAEHYFRGTAGMASAGTDTEGSQYFVMHQWAPHLNGSYTIIGEIIEGQDVIDRIIVGDVVRKVVITED